MLPALVALTLPEATERAELEAIIEQGMDTFVRVGGALKRIRDGLLYRNTHATFEAYVQEQFHLKRQRAYRLIEAAEIVDNLSPFGDILPGNEGQARPLTRLEPEQQRDAWQQAVADAPKDATTGLPLLTAARVEDAVRAVEGRPHVSQNAGNNEWYTPAPIIEAARRTMGGIDCDPASSAAANRTVNATRFFTVQSDGLRQQWGKRVFCNPPYAQPLVAQFCAAAAEKYVSGEVQQACILVNNATETVWFQTLLPHTAAICLPASRIRFLDPDGYPSGAPLQGQAILYFGDRASHFLAAFRAFGYVARLTP